jgi:hypothetical protein
VDSQPSLAGKLSPNAETSEVIFEDNFSTNKGWIDQSNGYIYRDTINNWLVWQTHRNYTRRYYIPISASPSSIHFEFRFRVTSFYGNGSVAFGLVENLDAPVQHAEIDATGFFVRIFRYTEGSGINWVLPALNYQNGDWYYPWEKKIDFQSINTWRKVVLDIQQHNWQLSVLTDSGNIIGQSSGTLPAQHSAYNYLMVVFDRVTGWETANGYIDDVIITSSASFPHTPTPTSSPTPTPTRSPTQNVIVEEFNSASDFTQTTPNITISGGRAHWFVSRSPAQSKQYIYRSIPEFFGDFRLTVRGRIDNWTNNCRVLAGVGDAPGSGISLAYAFYGGGCPTGGPNIQAAGATLSYEESALCTFTGDWLWITRGVDYTATMTVTGSNVTVSVPGVGSATGTRFYDGKFNTLFVGLTGDGDWPSCSGSIDYMEIEPLSDDKPPSAVTDLQASPGTSPGVINLGWTSPGDDGNIGTVTQYDIRYNTTPITEANWSVSTQIDGEPTPQAAGTQQSFSVTLPFPGQTYYFALKSVDDENLWSPLSNIASATAPAATDTIPPARITDLTARTGNTSGSVILTWTAPGDDESTGTASSYRVKYSTSPIDKSNWGSATDVSGEPTPKPAGSTETMTISGLTPGATYYFALKAYDEAGNSSGVSNSVSAIAYQPSQLLPDLKAFSLRVDPNTVEAGKKIKIDFTVKNVGASRAGFHSNTIYMTKDRNSSNPKEICNRNLSSLNVNETASFSCEVTVPLGSEGTYYAVSYTHLTLPTKA